MKSKIDRITAENGELVTGDSHVGLDELLAHGATVHLEQMGDSDHCLIVEAGGERVCIWIGAKKRKGSRPHVITSLAWREAV